MWLRFLISSALMLPLLAGLAGVILPASGYMPVLGLYEVSFASFQLLFTQPGIIKSLLMSLYTGLIATSISYCLAMGLLVCLYQQKQNSWLFRFISPLLSVPHVTVAVGFLFLFQPSGWLFRLISPYLTGWQRPPVLNIVPDEYGIMLIIGLVAKELPFFVLMALSHLSQMKSRQLLNTSSTLGYGQFSRWFYTVQPLLARRLSLVVMIVLVFSVSVVDMALVLAPSTPPLLAVRILNWFNDPDLSMRPLASAAALVQIGVMLCAALLWFSGRLIIGRCFLFMLRRGWRLSVPASAGAVLKAGVLVLCLLPVMLAVGGLMSSVVWAFADIWRFPSALPDQSGIKGWTVNADLLLMVSLNTACLGIVASGLSVIMAILWLESPSEATGPGRRLGYVIYAPLLIPQPAFLFGLQVMLILLGGDGQTAALLWAHCLFVFPYVMLSLSSSWREWDRAYDDCGAVLGASYFRRLVRVKLVMLMIPILTSFAVGFAVSAALYLPTVFVGNGRFLTLTTEAVVLASGAGRQPLGAASVLQMLMPLIMFLSCAALAKSRLGRFGYFKL